MNVVCPDWSAGNDPKALELNFPKALHSIMHIVNLLHIWLIETEDYQGKLLSIQVCCQSN